MACLFNLTRNGFTFWVDHHGAHAYITLTDTEILLRMAAPGNYVAFGFNSDHVSMIGSDIVVCGHRSSKLGVSDYCGLNLELQYWIMSRTGTL